MNYLDQQYHEDGSSKPNNSDNDITFTIAFVVAFVISFFMII
jgi:hypothetical protein